MSKIVIGLFESWASAEAAANALQAQGFSRQNISLTKGDELIQQGQVKSRDEKHGMWDSIREFFSMGSDDSTSVGGLAHVNANDALVSVSAHDDDLAESAADILNANGAIDLDERAAESSPDDSDDLESGASVGRASAPDMSPPERRAQTSLGSSASSKQSIPVVEEELSVGKRNISRGGVRIYAHIIERPVEEDILLREETVQVERQAVNRPLGAADASAFQDQTIEARETAEEPVVQKRARVKEEVTVSKQSRQRQEKVRDTVRGTEVKVEQLSPEEAREFAQYEPQFQSDWQTKYARSGIKYDEVLPGYQYGYHLARDPAYSAAEWSEIEPRVKSDWDQRGYGPWDRFKDAVRSGWDRAHH